MTLMAEPGTQQYRQEVTAHPKNLGDIRRIVSAYVRVWGHGPLVETTVFCANELLTNVHQHTESAQCVLTITLMRQPDRVRVVVSDSSTELPEVREPDFVAESGRGMASVQGVADVWGAEPNGTGKDVWFEIRASASRGEVAA